MDMKITLAQGLAVGLEGDRHRSRYHRTSCGTDVPDPLGDQGREESSLRIKIQAETDFMRK